MDHENKKPKTYVYIDSFNLYYGLLNKKKAGLKWLNIHEWLTKILPHNDVVNIKFFTARVSGKYDPSKPQRQDLFFRALKTIPNLEIIFGTFLFKDSKIHISHDVKILAKVPEEKGTDVNLVAHLVNDAHKGLFDVAVVVSNDSDLSEAIRIVTQELGKPVGIINPYDRFSKTLIKYSSFQKTAREHTVLGSQFPASLTDATGTFIKPSSW